MSTIWNWLVHWVDDPDEKLPVVIKYKGQGKDVSIAASFIKNWEETVNRVIERVIHRWNFIEVEMIYIQYKWFQKKESSFSNS